MIPPWLLELCIRLARNDAELLNLNLNIRRFDTEMLHALATALEPNKVLHTLNLTSSLVKASLFPLIHSVVSRHSSLQVLHLSYNRISDQNEIEALAQALTTNTSLTHLYLDHNNIDSEGAASLARALGDNETLQVLQLSSNQVCDDGARSLAVMLANNTTLTKLCLQRNKITSHGVESLLEYLQSNVTVEYLDLDKHHSNEEASSVHQELEFVLQTNRAGRRLLRRQHEVQLGLWAHVLGRISHQSDMVNYFVKEMPSLCRNAARRQR